MEPVCCITIRTTMNDDGSIAMKVILRSPDPDNVDHHEVYQKSFVGLDAVGSLERALKEYGDPGNTVLSVKH